MIENNLKLKYCLGKFNLCTKIHSSFNFNLPLVYSHKICLPAQEYNSRNVPLNGDTYVFQFLGQLCLLTYHSFLVLCTEVYVSHFSLC